MKLSLNPSFEFEGKLWSEGYEYVFGADEVGKGSFAGPVVAAVVCFSPEIVEVYKKLERTIVIRDSKKMTANQRKISDEWIRGNVLSYGIGESSVEEINSKGIQPATYSAYYRALGGTDLGQKIRKQYILVDGYIIPMVRDNGDIDKKSRKTENIVKNELKQMAIPKGDQRSFTISAASIIAKVYRDTLMEKLGRTKKHAYYEWHSNKGYGTKAHRDAIIKYGQSVHHRRQFVQTFLDRHSKSKKTN